MLKFEGSLQSQLWSYTAFQRHLLPRILKSYSRPKPTRLQTKCPATWLYPSPRTDRGDFFELWDLLRDSIPFLVLSHFTTQQAVEDSNRSPFQHANPNDLDTISAVSKISWFKPNNWRSISIQIHSASSVMYENTSFFNKKGGRFPNSQSTYHTYWQFSSVCPPQLHRQFLSIGPPSLLIIDSHIRPS